MRTIALLLAMAVCAVAGPSDTLAGKIVKAPFKAVAWPFHKHHKAPKK